MPSAEDRGAHPAGSPDLERELAAQMMVSLDGLWYMNVLEALGEEAAFAMDVRVFKSQFRLATRAIRRGRRLDGLSLSDKAAVFESMARIYGHEYVIIKESAAVTMRLTRCSFFENLKRVGRAEAHDCRGLCQAISRSWFSEMEPRTDGAGEVSLELPRGGAACDWTIYQPEEV